MGAFKWPLPLLIVWLHFKVFQTKSSSWTVTVPSTIKGLPGSCVVIPCSYNYPDPGKKVTEFTGIWTDATGHVIYHQVHSKILPAYQTRTELQGNIAHNNCSLKIDPLQQSDQGPFHFRIEIGGFDKYSYKDNAVSIAMNSDLYPTVSVQEEVLEGETVSATCSVSHSCPPSPPDFTWSHSGEKHLQSQQLSDGQWKATSTLTFQAAKADHDKPLRCTVSKGGQRWEKDSNVFKVKYAPVNVKVDYKSRVKEGEAVQLRCSSEAYPASSYQWHNDTGAQLHQGQSFTLPNVSRHTGSLSCTAINAVGQAKSSPVQFNVLFAPEIKTTSCSSEGDMVKCVCIVESRPSSSVRFVLSDRVLPSTKTDTHGYVTIGSLQAESGSSEFVQCLANNTLGSTNLTVPLSVSGKMQNVYIFIAIGAAVVLVTLVITVGVAKKCRGRQNLSTGDAATSDTSNTKAEKTVELPRYSTAKSIEMEYDDVQCPGIYSNDHVYGNLETVDCDDAVYENM
ncbi:hypothetical protein Q5P01_011064 [Channa striata]|uniref:Ig-like domain-containing protein n=1 Tax=Channa striata TaxID=64152 RepID=A0AA88SMI6_CHASR|nr:hypothetical protein Q5P01_011064 [Channa striata]